MTSQVLCFLLGMVVGAVCLYIGYTQGQANFAAHVFDMIEEERKN